MTPQQAFDLAVATFGKALVAVDGDADHTGTEAWRFCGERLAHPITYVRRGQLADWQDQLRLFAKHGVKKAGSAKVKTLAGTSWHLWEVEKV